jgi:hypothetical protein
MNTTTDQSVNNNNNTSNINVDNQQGDLTSNLDLSQPSSQRALQVGDEVYILGRGWDALETARQENSVGTIIRLHNNNTATANGTMKQKA